jgi:hypothetical protein
MRLPTCTAEQRRHEACRQRHEALYQGFLDGTRLHVAVTPESWIQIQNATSSRIRQYWAARGFLVRTATNKEKSALWVWLEAKPEHLQRTA